MRDAYEQPERLMLVHKAVSSDVDDHFTLASATLAKLSPPTKRTGCLQTVVPVVCLVNVFTVRFLFAVNHLFWLC